MDILHHDRKIDIVSSDEKEFREFREVRLRADEI